MENRLHDVTHELPGMGVRRGWNVRRRFARRLGLLGLSLFFFKIPQNPDPGRSESFEMTGNSCSRLAAEVARGAGSAIAGLGL